MNIVIEASHEKFSLNHSETEEQHTHKPSIIHQVEYHKLSNAKRTALSNTWGENKVLTTTEVVHRDSSRTYTIWGENTTFHLYNHILTTLAGVGGGERKLKEFVYTILKVSKADNFLGFFKLA